MSKTKYLCQHHADRYNAAIYTTERRDRLNGTDPTKLNCSAFPLFASQFHIIDRRFPLTPNNGYLPDDLTCRDYRA